MVPGKKYMGYGFINEYSEFQFMPAAVGSREGQKKLVKETPEYTLYETTKFIIVHTKVDKKLSFTERVSLLIKTINNVINALREYDF